MTLIGWIQIALFCAIVVALVKPLGWYMTRVFSGDKTFLSPILRPVEVGLYKIAGVDDRSEQDWLRYTVSMLLFHIGGFLIIYVLLRTQGALPFNPQGMTAFASDLSFNTAISFITNTNWQNYGGESSASYLAQMLGFTHQNFLSAATGIVLAIALIRGFSRASTRNLGNFWVDVTRCALYHGRHDNGGEPARPHRRRDDRDAACPWAIRNAGKRRMSAPPIKVLVIDDEPPIRKLLRMGLSTQGYQVIDAR